MKKISFIVVMLVALSMTALCQSKQKETKQDTVNCLIYPRSTDTTLQQGIDGLKKLNEKYKREKLINDLKEQEKRRQEEARLREELYKRRKQGASDRNKRIIKT